MSQSTSTAENRSERTAQQRPILGDHRTRYVRDHIGLLADLVALVDRQETFTVADLPPALAERISELREHNIIRVEAWVDEPRCAGKKRRAAWRVDRRAREGIEYWNTKITTWPCGHAATGFRNPVGVEGYTCPREHCSVTFCREIVEQRFQK
jgi:hypothetical protein